MIMRKVSELFRTISVAALLLLVSGCATNRGIIDVRVTPTPDPQGKVMVKIVRVTDQRTFELRPDVASIPSLKDGQIDNKAITSRAIARKRNGYGKALGDILLPEGRTVEDLVEEATVTKPLQYETENGTLAQRAADLLAEATALEGALHLPGVRGEGGPAGPRGSRVP